MRGQLPSIKPIKACGGFNRFFIAFHVCSQSIKLRRNSSNAEGIAIREPKRMDDMIKAVKDSKGDVIAVDDEEIITAQEMLGEMGFYVEVTSGVAVAGMLQYFDEGYDNKLNIVVPLTGMGLKK
jgi:threonine synthase